MNLNKTVPMLIRYEQTTQRLYGQTDFADMRERKFTAFANAAFNRIFKLYQTLF